MPSDHSDANRPPDWSILPTEYSYIRDAATRFGVIAEIDGSLTRRLKRSELTEVKALAKSIGKKNHANAMTSWFYATEPTHPLEAGLVGGLLVLMDAIGLDLKDSGPKRQPEWIINVWKTHHWSLLAGYGSETLEFLPEQEAFELIAQALTRIPKKLLPIRARLILGELRSKYSLDWIENNVPLSVSVVWGQLAAVSQFSWDRATAWLESGVPLSLVALDALRSMDGTSDSPIVQRADPHLIDPPSFEDASRVLMNALAKNRVVRVQRAVNAILAAWEQITGERAGWEIEQ